MGSFMCVVDCELLVTVLEVVIGDELEDEAVCDA